MKKILTCAIGLFFAFSNSHGVELEMTFENESAWTWHIKPTARFSSAASNGMLLRLQELKGNKLSLTMAYLIETKKDVAEFRPVAFTKSGRRLDFDGGGASSSNGLAMDTFSLDLKDASLEEIQFIGIEKLTKEALANTVAPTAFRRLKEADLNALPYPRLGERYGFNLVDENGKRFSVEGFKGKVVLLDFWASYCGPCMAKMPHLKETYEKFHDQGFEIIGINHDVPKKAHKVIEDQNLPWPNIIAPQSEDWSTAMGLRALPRLLLVDGNGILRADTSPNDLFAEIEKLMKK